MSSSGAGKKAAGGGSEVVRRSKRGGENNSSGGSGSARHDLTREVINVEEAKLRYLGLDPAKYKHRLSHGGDRAAGFGGGSGGSGSGEGGASDPTKTRRAGSTSGSTGGNDELLLELEAGDLAHHHASSEPGHSLDASVSGGGRSHG